MLLMSGTYNTVIRSGRKDVITVYCITNLYVQVKSIIIIIIIIITIINIKLIKRN